MRNYSTATRLSNLNEDGKISLYNLNGFSPRIINQAYLSSLGTSVKPTEITLRKLERGSVDFIERFRSRRVTPLPELVEEDLSLDTPLEVHNYTGHCPTNTYELNPVKGSCNVGCLYCLVSDGNHMAPITLFRNYDLYLRRVLQRNGTTRCFYYYSPKTEAFQEPTLETGIAHKILKEFIWHYKNNPDSGARLFIATKAGLKQLLYEHKGYTIIELLSDIRDKIQFNLSISMMPALIRDVLEPNAVSLEERVKAALLCQDAGIAATSVLLQPILEPYLSDVVIDDYFSLFKAAGLVNFKPEFLTLCVENLAMLGQIIGHFDKDLERKLYEQYLDPTNMDHIKQRERIAPERSISYKAIMRLKEAGTLNGLSMSVCYWVRQQVGISSKDVPLINEHGYLCLGYQTRLWDN